MSTLITQLRNRWLEENAISARSYVQNGLIAMWDGIENIGFGSHDSDSNTWKNLAGNDYDFNLGGMFHFNENSLVFQEAIGVEQSWLIPKENDATLEVCGISEQTSFKAFSLMRDAAETVAYMMFSILPNGDRGFQFSSGDGKSMFCDWYSHRWSVAGTFVGGSRSSQYYNGEFKNSNAGTSGWQMGGNGNAFLGYKIGSAMYCFVGSLNCIRVYNRALSAEEIASNYAIDKTRFNLP